MFAARQRERVDDPLGGYRRAPERRQLGVEEPHVEFGVVDDEAILADEGEEVVDHRGEDRLVGERSGRMAVDAERLLRHFAFGIDQGVKDDAGGDLVDDFHGADFDQADRPCRGRVRSSRCRGRFHASVGLLPGTAASARSTAATWRAGGRIGSRACR